MTQELREFPTEAVEVTVYNSATLIIKLVSRCNRATIRVRPYTVDTTFRVYASIYERDPGSPPTDLTYWTQIGSDFTVASGSSAIRLVEGGYVWLAVVGFTSGAETEVQVEVKLHGAR